MLIYFIIHYFFHFQNIREKYAAELQLKEETDDISFAREEIEMLDYPYEENYLIEVNEVLDLIDIRRKNFINHIEYEHYKKLVQIKNGDTVQNVPPIH